MASTGGVSYAMLEVHWPLGREMDSRVRVVDEVLFREVGGEAVLLQTATGQYYGLDAVGTRMWQLLAEEGGFEPACRKLLAEFDVEEERLRRDMLKLIDELKTHRLIEIDHGS